jgi:hypothetical protein
LGFGLIFLSKFGFYFIVFLSYTKIFDIMTDKVKKFTIKNAEVEENKCEICGIQSKTGMLDKQANLRWSCLDHIDDLYKKMNKE